MDTVRGILATLVVLFFLAACTNPFAPEDIGSPPEEEPGSGDQDRGQALAPAGPPVYFL